MGKLRLRKFYVQFNLKSLQLNAWNFSTWFLFDFGTWFFCLNIQKRVHEKWMKWRNKFSMDNFPISSLIFYSSVEYLQIKKSFPFWMEFVLFTIYDQIFLTITPFANIWYGAKTVALIFILAVFVAIFVLCLPCHIGSINATMFWKMFKSLFSCKFSFWKNLIAK